MVNCFLCNDKKEKELQSPLINVFLILKSIYVIAAFLITRSCYYHSIIRHDYLYITLSCIIEGFTNVLVFLTAFTSLLQLFLLNL